MLLSLVSFMSLSAFAEAPLEAYGLDTVAGHASVLRTSKTQANKAVVFDVRAPNGESFSLKGTANANGVAIEELNDFYTKRAGTYYVSVKPDGSSGSNRTTTFEVYPGDLSQNYSAISPGNQVMRSGDENAVLKVHLADEYQNPIEGHVVKLISSEATDSISLASESAATDANGDISFRVASAGLGTSSYSAYDLTSDAVLDSKAKIVYFNTKDSIFSTYSSSYSGPAGNASGPVDSFKFGEIPNELKVGQSVSLKISAVDAMDQVVSAYSGEVRFSVNGPNSNFVALPDDYEFKLSDQGEHVFSLAFNFQQAGVYELQVTDLANLAIFGKQTFNVTQGSSDPSGDQGVSAVSISSPIAGGSYSNNVQVITGKAPAGASLKIFDNDVQLATTVANAQGNFAYTTGILQDGEHSVYVGVVNDIGTITAASDIVAFSIDTAAPDIEQVEILPTGAIDPGSEVTVKLFASDELAGAKFALKGNVYDMVKSPQGYYEAKVAAPIDFGEYHLDFTITDTLGNEVVIKDMAQFSVGKLPDKAQGAELPNVSNLVATPSESRVTLNWTAPSTQTTINNYRVYYGLSPNQLTEVVDTFTNATTWYIPNLQNGVTYYFAVIPLDALGNTSKLLGDIVAGTPNVFVIDVVPPDVVNGSAGQEVIPELKKDPSDSGPEILWVVVLSLIGGHFYNSFRKKKNLV